MKFFGLTLLHALVASALVAPSPKAPIEERDGLQELDQVASGNATQDLAKRTGQGGYLNLVNGGSYTWRLTYSSKYQMNGWSFPSTVGAYSAARVYIEFDTSIGKNQKDDSGEATYTLDGTSWSFQIQARSPGGKFTLQTVLTGMATQNNAQGSTIPLGWVHDGHVNWVLSGQFTSSRPPPNWMQTNLGTIGSLTLQKLSMPGSHDAGMSRITGGTAFGNACNSLTQTQDIAGQLASGSRYFDIRPIITAGNFGTGHYTGDAAVLNTFQGANGQPMSEIISQINAFTAKYNELIIINLSHSLNTDVGTSDYRPLNEDEYNRLLNALMAINNRLETSRLPSGFNPSSGDLSTLTLNQLIGGRAGVAIVVQDSANLNSWYGKGVFNYGQYNVFNSYSNTDKLSTMTNDQINKLVNQHNKVFLLSWTLTLSGVGSAICTKSIIDLAKTANAELFKILLNSVSPTRNIVPNIVYLDAISNGDAVGVSMAYNWWQTHH